MIRRDIIKNKMEISQAAQRFFEFKLAPSKASKGNEDLLRFDLAEGLLNSDKKYSALPDKNPQHLKEILAEFVSCDSDNIAFFAGADEIIEIVPRLYLNYGDASLIVTPVFSRLIDTNVKVGAEVITYALSEDHNFKLTDQDVVNIVEIVKLKKIKVIWLCSPSNPTGVPIAVSKIKRLSTLCPDSLVVVNEVYQEYYSLNPKESAGSLIDSCSSLVVIRSFSKAFGLAGLRIGYAVASKRIIENFTRYKTMFNVSAVAQEEALRVLTTKAEIEKLISLTSLLRDQIQESIGILNNFEFIESKTNFIFMRHKTKDLFEELYRRGILVSDWRNAKGVEGRGFVRISVNSQRLNTILIESLKDINKS